MTLSQQIYQTFMVSVAVTMGASQETAEKDMQEVHDFELQLANISSISGNISTKDTASVPTILFSTISLFINYSRI